MSSLIGQLYYFEAVLNRLLLQLIGTDIENSLFKYKVSYGQLIVIGWTVNEKLCNYHLLVVNVQYATACLLVFIPKSIFQHIQFSVQQLKEDMQNQKSNAVYWCG